MAPPVVVLGAGVLGRRIASVFLAGGYDVHTRDPSDAALTAAKEYVAENIGAFTALTPGQPKPQPGTHRVYTDIASAVKDAWLVVEAVPEQLPLKIATFAEVHAAAPADCIIASNSSSFKSRLMIAGLPRERAQRVLNMHFTMPPAIRTVELMTSGETDEALFPLLTDVLTRCGVLPVTARRESTGFIFNRLWAAIKREIMMILAEDVSSAAEIDLLWENMFQLPTSLPPCKLMDQIGLDTVAFIEDNYVGERGLDTTLTVDWLREKYIKPGKLGKKSELGGLYPAAAPAAAPAAVASSSSSESAGASTRPSTASSAPENTGKKDLLVLDVGLGSNNADLSAIPTAGRILRFDTASRTMTPVVTGQSLPDGIDVAREAGRMFWTNMGRSTSTCDGSVHSARLDGSDVQTIIPSGAVHTPKQLIVDETTSRVYFCDREGMGVHRVRFDGTEHETIVKTGCATQNKGEMTRWCVGIALDAERGLVYWTQKGPSKGGQGRIFRAPVDVPAGRTAEDRDDVELVLDGLPEPIDLELDTAGQTLYWTDRGEHPVGCSLNRVAVGGDGGVEDRRGKKEILARQFHEPIGLKRDATGNAVYVLDLGGCVYRVKDGKKEKLWQDDACYTGVCFA